MTKYPIPAPVSMGAVEDGPLVAAYEPDSTAPVGLVAVLDDVDHEPLLVLTPSQARPLGALLVAAASDDQG